MKYSYYPGCTLRTKAKKLDDYARASAKALGFENGGKVLCCGNGGSAADCDHFAGELLKGFLKKIPTFLNTIRTSSDTCLWTNIRIFHVRGLI